MTTTWEHPEEEENAAHGQQFSGLLDPREMPQRGFGYNASSSLLGDPFESLDPGTRSHGSEPASSPAGNIWSSAPSCGNSLNHSGALTVTIGDIVLPASETSSYHAFEVSNNHADSALLHYNNALLSSGGRAAVPAVNLNPSPSRHSAPMLQPHAPGSSTSASAAPLGSHFPVVRAVSGSEADGYGSFSRNLFSRISRASSPGFSRIFTGQQQINAHPLTQEKEQEPAQQMQQHTAMQLGQLW